MTSKLFKKSISSILQISIVSFHPSFINRNPRRPLHQSCENPVGRRVSRDLNFPSDSSHPYAFTSRHGYTQFAISFANVCVTISWTYSLYQPLRRLMLHRKNRGVIFIAGNIQVGMKLAFSPWKKEDTMSWYDNHYLQLKVNFTHVKVTFVALP